MSVASAARWTGGLIWRHKVISGSVAVFAAAIIAVSLATSSNASSAAAGPAAPAAPGFTVAALGTPGSVSLSQYQGKPLIVNFWASWCDVCESETPLLASWYKQEHGQIALLGLDENDATSKALAFAHAKGVTYTLGFDPQMNVAGAYNIDGLPQTYFLNARHRIVEHVLGAMTKADLAEGVSLMNAPQTPAEKVIEPS
jgi:thiol-disulfide isomerase/thioredoxin